MNATINAVAKLIIDLIIPIMVTPIIHSQNFRGEIKMFEIFLVHMSSKRATFDSYWDLSTKSQNESPETIRNNIGVKFSDILEIYALVIPQITRFKAGV